jgi:hypothetical protein
VLDHPTVSRVHCRLGIVREDDGELFCTIVDGQSNVGQTTASTSKGSPSGMATRTGSLISMRMSKMAGFML